MRQITWEIFESTGTVSGIWLQRITRVQSAAHQYSGQLQGLNYTKGACTGVSDIPIVVLAQQCPLLKTLEL